MMEIRKQLESLKQLQEKNALNRLAYGSSVAEFILGLYLLVRAVFMNADVPFLAQLALFAMGLVLICHAIVLVMRSHYDRRTIKMLEMFLSRSEPSNES